jgi:hypothetical protein
MVENQLEKPEEPVTGPVKAATLFSAYARTRRERHFINLS